MNEVIVIIGASCNMGWLSTYCTQLQLADIPIHVENLAGQPWLDRGGFIGEKIASLRKLTVRFGQYERIVFSDGFDVQFFGTRQELIERIPEKFVLHAAEKNCYPDDSLEQVIPNLSPWRFANGGLCCGKPQMFLEWCDIMETRPGYNPRIIDQGFMNMRLAHGDPMVQIDWNTDLFFCLYKGYDELQFVRGKPHNTYFDTHPLFIHANGKWDASAMLQRYNKSLE